MKAALIIFHKNIDQYPKEWANMYLNSIKKQTFRDKFDVFEIDYGGTGNKIFKGSEFYSIPMSNHADAHNFLCYKAVDKGYDYVFNTNIDDVYHFQRVEHQFPYLKRGYDVISCNHTIIDADSVIKRQDIPFHTMDLETHFFQKNHNPFSHPGAVYSKNFIENSGMLIPDEIPKDDFNLWKRSFYNFTFIVVPYTLLFYRDHVGGISSKKKK